MNYLQILTRFGIAFLLFLGVFPFATFAQRNEVGGLQAVLPKIPLTPSVPVDAPEGAASFIASLKGNDAALEILLGQGRIITVAQPLADEQGSSLVAIGDPSIVEFEILPNPRMIRLLGVRPGITDLTVVLANGDSHAYEVHVVYDLTLLRARLQQMFPTAAIRLGQVREHIVVEGQARSPIQIQQITSTVSAFLGSRARGARRASGIASSRVGAAADGSPDQPASPQASSEEGRSQVSISAGGPRVINLMRVPSVQQVLLKVQIAELNRTALREIGADIAGVSGNGSILGTQIGGAAVTALSTLGLGGLTGAAGQALTPATTAFGIFPSTDYAILFRALRQNDLISILAEPNLIAMSGHKASFLAGGEFPIPVAQTSGATNNVTVEFREFGVRLDFIPQVLDDDRIRLSVTPEVSSIDFRIGTTLVVGGDPVPGLSTRRAHTTVELEQGNTLAMAGLLQVELEGGTKRIPVLGDMPYLGQFFSNTSNRRLEKELIVMVTPYLVQPMQAHEIPPLPGQEIEDPTDWEIYGLNRFEGRTGVRFRSTVQYDPFCQDSVIEYERTNIQGPVGFSTLDSN